jgi:hypothetical protein
MKKITLLSLLFISNFCFAQDEMITHSGIVNFEASVPLFEEVKATNETSSCTLNTNTGAITNVVIIKDFCFKIPIMEEHFNENYLESDRHPKAIFKGKIQGFNLNIIGTDSKEFVMKGKLEIHGKSKEISIPVFIKKVGDGLEIRSNFKVSINDFNIKIPRVLILKIAENVTVKTNYLVQLKSRNLTVKIVDNLE